jgi:hypothetical protein
VIHSKLLPQTRIIDKFATVNGKSYRLLRAYTMPDAAPGNSWEEDYVFLALAGRSRLASSDLGEHWRVARSGDVHLAYYARAFSYHLLGGAETAPVAEDWPRIKASSWLVFVGPTSEAALEAARLTLRQYRPHLSPQQVNAFIKAKGETLDDQMGGEAKALRLPLE